MLQLICEGRCNPTLAVVTRAVEVAEVTPVECSDSDGVEAVRFIRGDPRLWTAQRQLQHTAHVATRPCHAACLTCGTERRFGNAA